ncbi:GntR family transcriptional regulator [Arthrobacter rhombi]|uniref:GntR family transcriptional regulator n=1 Tax=Arthrobacter rhombi TaxID=71253 RepID=UPI003FD56F7A
MTRGFWESAVGCITADGGPAHTQIEAWLLDAINRGRLAHGQKFPTERALASSLNVSRMTLRQALSTLEARGWITRLRGADGGTFVSSPSFDVDLTDLAGLTAQVARAGRTAGATVIEARTISAEAFVAHELQIGIGAPVHYIVRVRSADGEPVCIERSYFPAEAFPDMLESPLDGSLYALLGTNGAAPTDALEYLRATVANDEDAQLILTDPGAAVMLVQRLATDVNQQPVEFSLDVYRSDRIRLVVKSALRSDLNEQEDAAGRLYQDL